MSEQFEALGASIGVRSVVIVGGVDMMDQGIFTRKVMHSKLLFLDVFISLPDIFLAIALARKPHIIVRD